MVVKSWSHGGGGENLWKIYKYNKARKFSKISCPRKIIEKFTSIKRHEIFENFRAFWHLEIFRWKSLLLLCIHRRRRSEKISKCQKARKFSKISCPRKIIEKFTSIKRHEIFENFRAFWHLEIFRWKSLLLLCIHRRRRSEKISKCQKARKFSKISCPWKIIEKFSLRTKTRFGS